MLGIPATLAGCKEIVVCSPANSDGSIDPAILHTANEIGINKIFKVGGAQGLHTEKLQFAYGNSTKLQHD
jgi:histidinol dehydrogenase